MRLTQVLLLQAKKYKRHRLPGGHIYMGKHRITVPPTALEVAQLNRELEIEDKNMYYLRHSYLNEGESKILKSTREYLNNAILEYRQYRMDKFSRHVRISDHLAHLKHGERWE